MKLKFVAAAAALMVSSLGAQAVTTVLGAAVVGTPLAFAGIASPGPFNDIFTFTLPTNNGSGYSVTNFILLPGLYNTILATMSLVANPDGILFNLDDTVLSTSTTPGAGNLSLAWASSPAGSYYLNVTGLSNGAQGGIYNGAISVTAPIPEPDTYAMLLAGLGTVGFLARRRKNG